MAIMKLSELYILLYVVTSMCHMGLGVVWGFECSKCVCVSVCVCARAIYVLLSASYERKLCKDQFPQGSI